MPGRPRRRRRADVSTEEPRESHSARIYKSLKTTIEAEAPLREQSPSEATEHIIKLGLPLYLKRFKRKFEPVAEAHS